MNLIFSWTALWILEATQLKADELNLAWHLTVRVEAHPLPSQGRQHFGIAATVFLLSTRYGVFAPLQLLLTEARGLWGAAILLRAGRGLSTGQCVAASSSVPVRAQVKSESKTAHHICCYRSTGQTHSPGGNTTPRHSTGQQPTTYREITPDQHIIAPKTKKWCLCWSAMVKKIAFRKTEDQRSSHLNQCIYSCKSDSFSSKEAQLCYFTTMAGRLFICAQYNF